MQPAYIMDTTTCKHKVLLGAQINTETQPWDTGPASCQWPLISHPAACLLAQSGVQDTLREKKWSLVGNKALAMVTPATKECWPYIFRMLHIQNTYYS
eukprot:1158785-Pelagomonas_calceolata.AAC.6